MELKISVPVGEVFDKLSILEIKRKKISDPAKLSHVNTEIEKILPEIQHLLEKNKTLYDYLLIINEKIWDLLDHTKDLKLSCIDFNNLSYQIYHENDARFRVKSLIDKQNTSLISEVKSYKKEKVIFLGCPNLHPKIREIYETFLSFYFDTIIYITSEEDIEEDTYVYNLLKPDIQPRYSHLYNSVLIDRISQNYTNDTINYLHSGALGDLIHCMYVIKVNYLIYGKNGNLFIKTTFFTRDGNQTYKDIKNIIEKQEYINKLELYESQNIEINLDKFRDSASLYQVDWLSNLSLTFNVPHLSMSWIRCDKTFKNNDKIIINRSLHRHISNFPWEKIVTNNSCSFLTYNIADYNSFPFKEKVELLHVKTFDQMIDIIGNCKFYIGNQSAPLAIAYSLGKPCLGELFSIDAKLYMDLDKYNEFIWMTINNNNLNPDILSKYQINLL